MFTVDNSIRLPNKQIFVHCIFATVLLYLSLVTGLGVFRVCPVSLSTDICVLNILKFIHCIPLGCVVNCGTYVYLHYVHAFVLPTVVYLTV